MPKKHNRKPRGKIRQQIRWAIEDTSFWDDDLLTADDSFVNPEIKEKDRPSKPLRNKEKVRKNTRTDHDLWLINDSS